MMSWGKTSNISVFLLISFTFGTVFPKQHPTRVVNLEEIEHLVPCRPDLAICELALDPIPGNKFGKALNINVTILQRVLAENLYVEGIVLKLSENNEYKRTGVYHKKNFCEFLNHDLKTFVNFDTNPVFENFQLTCPFIEPNNYFIRNFTVDTSDETSRLAPFLQLLPLWTIKVLITIGGCPHSDLYNNSIWNEAGVIICHRAAIIATVSEVY